MPIKIPIKKSPTSNKPQTTPNSDSAPAFPSPFIDKISLVLKPDTDKNSYDIYNAVHTYKDDTSLFSDTHKGTATGWKLAKRINLYSVVDIKRYPLFQFDYDSTTKLTKRLRFEFVPVDLGQAGIEELHIAVNTFLPDGWSYVVKHARVTRLDVTADLPAGIRMDDFLFLPQQSATVTRWEFNGKLQSYYSGKSTGSQTKIYDRKAKRLSKGQSWPENTVVRIERKLANIPKLTLPGLYQLNNPFSKMILTQNFPPPPTMPQGKEWVWTMFCDSVKVRGLKDALALLPSAQKAKFRKHFAAYPQPWWKPDQIWKGWPSMLDELQIAKLLW